MLCEQECCGVAAAAAAAQWVGERVARLALGRSFPAKDCAWPPGVSKVSARRLRYVCRILV